MLGPWHWNLRCLVFLSILRLRQGLVVSPDSISVFSAHPGVIHRNITLENPTSSDIAVRLELSKRTESSARRLAALSGEVQIFSEDSLCNGTSRLLLRWRQPGGQNGKAYRRLAEDPAIVRWHHLQNLDLDIVDLNCSGQTPEETLGQLKHRFGLELSFVELDQKVHLLDSGFSATPDDPSWPNLWGMARVDVERAWARVQELGVQSQEVVVAVIDSGVQLDHPDLRDMLWTNPGEIPGNGVDDDGNGYVDDVHGYNFFDYNGNPDDDDGHGTHCAGVVAATANNGIGVAGVASRLAQARIMAIRFLSTDGGRTSDAVLSLEYAIANGAQISSNSWGGGGQSAALRAALQRAAEVDHLFIAAAGNDGKDVDVSPDYPCAYKGPAELCVAATQADDQLAWYSNFGPDTVHLAAPGSDIYSTMIGSSYAPLSGTSMATPHVSGAAVLAMSSFHLGGAQTRQLILDSIEPLANLATAVGTGGILDVEGLIFAAESYALFWLLPEGGNKSATAVVTVPAQSTVQVSVQMGSPVAQSGVREAAVNVTWSDGSALIPVTLTIQGPVELQLSSATLDIQATTNFTSSASVTISNSGNGTGQLQLEPLSPPFFSDTANVTLAAGADVTVRIECRPTSPGEFTAEAVFRTNAGLDPWSSTLPNATDIGEALTLPINCTSTSPPLLVVTNFTGAAEVLASAPGLRHFQPCIPAIWEPYLPGSSIEADVVLPASDNGEGCNDHSGISATGMVLLVSRGNCFFNDKAEKASDAGAVGVLIYDNQAPTTLDMMGMPSTATFPDVPAFLISQEQGQDLLARLQGGGSPRVLLRWEGMRAFTGRPPFAEHPASVTFEVGNEGDGPLSWEVRPEVRFGKTQSRFYEYSFAGSVLNPSSPAPDFAWASPPNSSELGSFAANRADDDAVLYSLPFNFSFYGQTFDQVYVSSNGLLVFNMEYSPGQDFLALANTAAPNGVVAGFWWDLVCGDCRISAAHLVEDSGEMVVFQFYNMAFFDPSYPYFAGPSTVSFEIRLLLDGRIFFMYQSFPTNTASYLNALIGLETYTGDSGVSLRTALQTLFAGQSPFAVSFTPWVTAAVPTSGILAPGSTSSVRYDVYSTTGDVGFFMVDGADGTGTWQSQQRIRFAQDKFRFTASAGDWGSCVSDDCDSSTGIRTRPVDCLGMDGKLYDVDPFCLSLCSDSIANWRDLDGYNCLDYETNQWCTADGSSGSGWAFFWGALSNYAFGGYDATTACCACGGGLPSSTPAATEVCSENLTFPDRDCDGIPDCVDACPDDPNPTCTSTTTSTVSTRTSSSVSSSTTLTTQTRSTSATITSTGTTLTSSETSSSSRTQSTTSSTISTSSDTSTAPTTTSTWTESTSITRSSTQTLTGSSTQTVTITRSSTQTVTITRSSTTRSTTATSTTTESTRTTTWTQTWTSSTTRTQTTTTSTTCTSSTSSTTTRTFSKTTSTTTSTGTRSTTATTSGTSTETGAVTSTSSSSSRSSTPREESADATTTSSTGSFSLLAGITTSTLDNPFAGDPFGTQEATDGVADRGSPLARYAALCPLMLLATWAQ